MPSEKGVKGQIVRYLHDPDEIEVIADSFDEYLEKLMEHDLDFISKDTIY
ncbi:SMI1/KNR4 family protein [Fusobacterium nucleatum]